MHKPINPKLVYSQADIKRIERELAELKKNRGAMAQAMIYRLTSMLQQQGMM